MILTTSLIYFINILSSYAFRINFDSLACVFQEVYTCHMSCQIYWQKLFIISPLLFFFVYIIYNESTSLISDLGHFCCLSSFSFFILSSQQSTQGFINFSGLFKEAFGYTCFSIIQISTLIFIVFFYLLGFNMVFFLAVTELKGSPDGSVGKETTCDAED